MIQQFTKEFIKNFTKHNLHYIEYIEIKVRNPAKHMFFNDKIYESTIYFTKKDMRIFKTHKNNDIDELYKEINMFIENEVKI